MDDLRQIIEGLIDCGAVLFDVQTDDNKRNFLRVWSTRELLTDDIRDALILRWLDSLAILREELRDRIDLSGVNGLCVWQSDRGFDAHDLTFTRRRGHFFGRYRGG